MKNNALWEQLQLNEHCGYYSIVQKNDGRVSIVSNKKDDSYLRFSGFFDDLAQAKKYIGTSAISNLDIEVVELQEKEAKIIGTLLPHECMGNELLPVGTKVVIHTPENIKYHGKVGTIADVADSDIPYKVVYDDISFNGDYDWYNRHQVKPYYPEASEQSEQDDKMEEGMDEETLRAIERRSVNPTKEEPKPECDHLVGWIGSWRYMNDEGVQLVWLSELEVTDLTYLDKFYCCPQKDCYQMINWEEIKKKLNLKKDE